MDRGSFRETLYIEESNSVISKFRGPFRETLYIENPTASSLNLEDRLKYAAGKRREPFGALYLEYMRL
jgi:hypothetical protein